MVKGFILEKCFYLSVLFKSSKLFTLHIPTKLFVVQPEIMELIERFEEAEKQQVPAQPLNAHRKVLVCDLLRLALHFCHNRPAAQTAPPSTATASALSAASASGTGAVGVSGRSTGVTARESKLYQKLFGKALQFLVNSCSHRLQAAAHSLPFAPALTLTFPELSHDLQLQNECDLPAYFIHLNHFIKTLQD